MHDPEQPPSRLLASFVDGKAQGQIRVTNRGLSYGDGVFTTLRSLEGSPRDWSLHLSRLQRDCLSLQLPYEQWDRLTQNVNILSQQFANAIIKVVITRGDGGRGYLPAQATVCQDIIQVHTLPDDSQIPKEGLRLRVCDYRLGHQPRLAGVKHLNRLDNVLARMEWRDPDIHEGILCDLSGHVIECTSSNLFFVLNQQLITPSLNDCGVRGVMREKVCEISRSLGVSVQELTVELDVLYQASEIVICNSVMGVRSVARIEDRTFACGEVTTKIMQALNFA